jgi:ribosomal protein L32
VSKKKKATRRWQRSVRYPGYEECLIDGHLHTRPKAPEQRCPLCNAIAGTCIHNL